ncbi:AraC family transcriptional regulator [Lysobacter enzymogenes]|uniref:AraC family transcriptional regulator n=1 Tax=Lysobacter enzymogenes TaxID=69 RepID=UPI00099B587B|nr:AraC family transcriptional regulator [Lysobacter enzymogenes]UZW62202.1 AraC family transcriptional regulator [Lysobacter enzymogenes]
MIVDIHSSDPTYWLEAMRKLYAGGVARFRSEPGSSLTIGGAEQEHLAVYEVHHSAPFECAASAPRDAHLIVVGIRGEGVFDHERGGFRCAPGSAGVVSGEGEWRIQAQAALGYLLIRIDQRGLGGQHDGSPPAGADRAIAFEPAALSCELSRHLHQAAVAMLQVLRMQWCPAAAVGALLEHVLSLLAEMHPHDPRIHPGQRAWFGKRQAREARWLIENATRPLSMGMLAEQMRCPIAQLVVGFGQHLPELSLEALLRTTWRRPPAAGDLRGEREPRTGADAGSPAGVEAALRLTVAQVVGVDEFIQRHLGDKIAIDDLARCAGLDRAKFSLRFRATFGVTPAQYLIRQRLERAKCLLERTNRSIADIAVETGFSSHSHLSSQFLRRVGVSPRAFRLGAGAAARDAPVPAWASARPGVDAARAGPGPDRGRARNRGRGAALDPGLIARRESAGPPSRRG